MNKKLKQFTRARIFNLNPKKEVMPLEDKIILWVTGIMALGLFALILFN